MKASLIVDILEWALVACIFLTVGAGAHFIWFVLDQRTKRKRAGMVDYNDSKWWP